MSPRITVIISCYNYAQYLPDAVHSVLRQSLEDWEAIVIDDASSDNTAEVMRAFTDSRIVCVYHKENRGNIVTYNEGIALARGADVVVLSADDQYHPDFFKRTVAMLDDHPEAGMVYTGWEVINDRGLFIRQVAQPHAEDGVYDELPLLVLHCHIAQCAAVVRKRVYQEVGLFVYPRDGDWDMWLRIARKYPIAFIRQSLYRYRRHGDNMSVNFESLTRMEQEYDQIITSLFADTTLPLHVRCLKRKATAFLCWNSAHFRFMRRDWWGGIHMLFKAISLDATVVMHPRRWTGMVSSIMQGISRRSWSWCMRVVGSSAMWPWGLKRICRPVRRIR